MNLKIFFSRPSSRTGSSPAAVNGVRIPQSSGRFYQPSGIPTDVFIKGRSIDFLILHVIHLKTSVEFRCTSTEDPECYENGGFMLMDEVENNKRIWRCEKCKYVEEVQNKSLLTRFGEICKKKILPQLLLQDDLITQLTDDMNSKVKGTSCMADPQVWEELLSEGLKTFHSNHHLNMDAKRVLIQLYGSLPGFRLNELSDDLLQRKFDFCKEYIELYAKVQSDQILLYKYHYIWPLFSPRSTPVIRRGKAGFSKRCPRPRPCSPNEK